MRRILVQLSALALVLALGAPAFAGGWAATTLDELPPGIHAGSTYSIGYTIRQHGVTPVNIEHFGGTTEIKITSPDGAKTLSYPGVQEGATGHYIAKVTFPYEGAWKWQVTQGAFAPHDLGPVKVSAAVAAPAEGAPVAAPAQQSPQLDPLTIAALVLATAGAAVLFGTRIAAFTGRRASA